MTAGGTWGVPAYEGPDSPQSSVQLCPVCLHPADSEAHRAAVERMNRRADQQRARDAELRAQQLATAAATREPVERTLAQAEEIRCQTAQEVDWRAEGIHRRLAERAEPGTARQEQRKMIAALLIEREPVFRLNSMVEFLGRILGEQWPPTKTLAELSAQQAGDILEALEAERRATRTPPRHAAADYQPKRKPGTPARRQARGAHRA